MTGLRAFEGEMPFQKYQAPPIVVRYISFYMYISFFDFQLLLTKRFMKVLTLNIFALIGTLKTTLKLIMLDIFNSMTSLIFLQSAEFSGD